MPSNDRDLGQPAPPATTTEPQLRDNGVTPGAPATAHLAPGTTVGGGRWMVQATVSEGHRAVVHRGVETTTGRAVAVKVIKAVTQASPPPGLNGMEADWMQSMAPAEAWFFRHGPRHPNIVSCDTVLEPAGGGNGNVSNIVVMEWVEWSSFDLMRQAAEQGRRIEENDIKRLGGQTLLALQAMHDAGVAHCDMTPENILIKPPQHEGGQWSVRLAGFGLAHDCTLPRSGAPGGAIGYVAPEALDDSGEPYDARAADIWSLGTVLFNAYTSLCPWDAAVMSDSLFNCHCSDPDTFSVWMRHYCAWPVSEDFEDLFMIMCNHRPEERPTVAQCLEHPFFSGGER